MIEVEVKIPIDNCNILRKRLLDAGYLCGEHLEETDRYFDNKAGQIKDGDGALRIRKTIFTDSGESVALMTYKGAKIDAQTVSRPEW